MEITLASTDGPLCAAWERAFANAGVRIHRGSILDIACDALVSPANSFGFMDGGIDAVYSHHFGWDIQLQLRRVILDRHGGELLVGSAEIVETNHPVHPFLIAAPTMRVPMVLDPKTINPFLAMRAALLLVIRGTFSSGSFAGQAVQSRVRSIALPGLGTGVGRVPATLCARQMRAAFDEFLLGRFQMPKSWAEASERHQSLYTDCPVRLQ